MMPFAMLKDRTFVLRPRGWWFTFELIKVKSRFFGRVPPVVFKAYKYEYKLTGVQSIRTYNVKMSHY
jgi:hypothetical protein